MRTRARNESPKAAPVEDVARRRFCLLALAVTIFLGLIWRLAPLHLPRFAFKYGGSALWAIAVYWAVAAILVRRSVLTVSLLAAVFALEVEFLKKSYWPPLDHFRDTLAGKLLLGRYFSYEAIAAYWVALAAAAMLDAYQVRWRRPADTAQA